MAKYPIYLELADKRVVIVGGGAVAARKAKQIIEAGARTVIVAEHISEDLQAVCKGTNAEIIQSGYSKSYLVEAHLVIAATDNHTLNSRIYRHCQKLEILCNVVDEPKLCDFFIPAVVKKGGLQIAIGTEGNCPAYAGHIRKKLEELFTERHGQFLAELEKIRSRIIETVPHADIRKTILGRLVSDESFEIYKQKSPSEWNEWADEVISEFMGQPTA